MQNHARMSFAESRRIKTKSKSSVSAISCVKPLPWRGQRGLGLRSKPLLMKKGLGLMEKRGFCTIQASKNSSGG